jgi:hypothetical protein
MVLMGVHWRLSRGLFVGLCAIGCGLLGSIGVAQAAPEAPVTNAAQNVTNTTAVFEGVLNPGGSAVAGWYFDYSTGVACTGGSATPVQGEVEGESLPEQFSVTGLEPGKRYTVCLVATNEVGESTVGTEISFETTSVPLSVEDESVLNVSATSATFQAQLNPQGWQTTYRFEYGPSAFYGTSAPVPDGILEGSTVTAVDVHRQDLTPSTTYHYRLVATSSIETVYGKDQTFTTQAVGAAFALPDNRQYELVSPANKYGAGVVNLAYDGGGPVQAAEDGGAISYLTNQPPIPNPPSGGNGAQILSRRGSGAWSSQDIDATDSAATGLAAGVGTPFKVFSSDLSNGLLEYLYAGGGGRPQEPLSKEVPAGITDDLYIRNTIAGGFLPLVTEVPLGTDGSSFGEGEFEGVSPELNDIVFSSSVALTPNAPSGNNLYAWAAGRLALVNVLPNGTPEAGGGLGGIGGTYTSYDVRNAISTDGSRVVWTAREAPNKPLYERDMTAGTTVQVDAPQGGGPDAGGDSLYQLTSSEGRKIFFTSQAELTHDADTGPSCGTFRCGNDLYVFDAASGELTDLTADHNPADANGAEVPVRGGVLGASADGSYIYFVAKGNLAGGATSGLMNLYARHYDPEKGEWEQPRFIADLSPDDEHDWKTLYGSESTSRVSPNGHYVTFVSVARLTGYDNTDANSDQPDAEVYLYDYRANRVICASCNPTGARPIGEYDDGLQMDRTQAWENQWVSAMIPAWTQIRNQRAIYQSRFLSDEGRLFFDSADALVPQDTNGKEDVYEYEQAGAGGCRSTDGCVYLISGGGGSADSTFMDASASGNDVFFRTNDRLAPQDYDHLFDIYDAHACLAAAPCFAVPSVPPPPCASSDACKPSPTPQPTLFGAPASATFAGNGNVVRSGAVVKPRSKRKPVRHEHKRKDKRRAKKSRARTTSSRGARR